MTVGHESFGKGLRLKFQVSQAIDLWWAWMMNLHKLAHILYVTAFFY